MNNKNKPNPLTIYPVINSNKVIYIKPTIKKKNVIVGDFTYFRDTNFLKNISYHFDYLQDKLIIGKFCQIGANVNFLMNGANHQINCVTTFPFYMFNGWDHKAPTIKELPYKGDTIIGNDVWIGENVTILPGIKIGDGVIIGSNSVVTKNIDNYHVVGGNPAKIIRKRFSDSLIELLLKLRWWDLPIEQINKLIPILTNPDLDYVKQEIDEILKGKST